MAVCTTCAGEMTEHISCLSTPIAIGGRLFDPIRWGEEVESRRWTIDFPCRDCGTPPGGVHHPGCCVERCPGCLGQAFWCPCFQEPEGDDRPVAMPLTRVRRRRRRHIRSFCQAHLLPGHRRH